MFANLCPNLPVLQSYLSLPYMLACVFFQVTTKLIADELRSVLPSKFMSQFI